MGIPATGKAIEVHGFVFSRFDDGQIVEEWEVIDQLAFLERLGRLSGLDFRAAIYDGDTPPHQRAKLRRRNPNIIMTNPEMLHLSMLAQHGAWAKFWSRCTASASKTSSRRFPPNSGSPWST